MPVPDWAELRCWKRLRDRWQCDKWTVLEHLVVAWRLSGISPYPDNGAAVAAGHQKLVISYFNTTIGGLSVVLGA